MFSDIELTSNVDAVIEYISTQYAESLQYITLVNDNNVLLLKTVTNVKFLAELSNKIYFTAQNSQVFLFLTKEEKQMIFTRFNEKTLSDSYGKVLHEAKRNLKGFFTFDVSSP